MLLQSGSGISAQALLPRAFSSGSNALNSEYGSSMNSSAELLPGDMATVGAGLPVLFLVERRGWGVAKALKSSTFQHRGVDVDRRGRTISRICCSLQSPNKKGFGKAPTKKKTVEKKPDSVEGRVADTGSDRSLEEEAEDDVVPEVVTNRMLRRISLTVGVPLAVGVLFFPLYYYLKVVNKVDVPEWLPLLTSMLTFGTAGLGISYGVLSASWDPAREGSLLGWKEAQLNWPVLVETVQGKKGKK